MKNNYKNNNKINKRKQLKIINKATEHAIQQIEKERKFQKPLNHFVEWFRYIELTSKQLKKYLN